MRLLLDTHLLVWAADARDRLPAAAADLLNDPTIKPLFSAASMWELAIKSGRPKSGFDVDIRELRSRLCTSGYVELPVTTEHAWALRRLPPIHKDPFDRILIAQSLAENITLATAHAVIARYPGPIRRV